MFKLTIDVEWGMLDIFGEEEKGRTSPDATCTFRCQGGDPKTADIICQAFVLVHN